MVIVIATTMFMVLSIGGDFKQWGDDMASAEREPIPGVWGQSPRRGPGAEPLVRGSEGQSSLKLKENGFLLCFVVQYGNIVVKMEKSLIFVY